MAKGDPQQIVAAARRAAETARPRLEEAIQYVEKYTTIHENAFGMLSSSVLKSYDPARESQLKNLKDGRDKLDQMIDGMVAVARNMATTEKLNEIDRKGAPKVEKPHVPRQEIITDLFISLQSLGLWLGFLAAESCKWAHTALFPPAIASIFVWILVEPDEEDVQEAIAAWRKAAEAIDAIDSLRKVLALPAEAWSDDAEGTSRANFEEWVDRFQLELVDARAYAAGAPGSEGGGVAGELDSVIKSIHDLQLNMLIIDIGTLTALILTYFVKQINHPVAQAVAKAGQWVAAIVNAAFTGIIAFSILSSVAGAVLAIRGVDTGKFEELDIEDDGYRGNHDEKDTFVDLDVDWA